MNASVPRQVLLPLAIENLGSGQPARSTCCRVYSNDWLLEASEAVSGFKSSVPNAPKCDGMHRVASRDTSHPTDWAAWLAAPPCPLHLHSESR